MTNTEYGTSFNAIFFDDRKVVKKTTNSVSHYQRMETKYSALLENEAQNLIDYNL